MKILVWVKKGFGWSILIHPNLVQVDQIWLPKLILPDQKQSGLQINKIHVGHLLQVYALHNVIILSIIYK